jgi:hypothetical protein
LQLNGVELDTVALVGALAVVEVEVFIQISLELIELLVEGLAEGD